MNGLKRFGSNLRTSFWFVPTLIVVLSTIASLTSSPARRPILREEAECIGELAGRAIESPRDRARFASRLAHLREALDTEPALAQSTKA